jgi:hypothetical protein
MESEQDIYAQQRERKRLEREGEGVPDGAGWKHRTLPSGEVEWCPVDRDWAPAGYRWNIDSLDRFANGGHVPADRSQPTVPKLERIRFGPTHPSRPEPVHFDSAKGVRYRS